MPVIYPAYSTSLDDITAGIISGTNTINVYCASLAYGVWSTHWPASYVATTNHAQLPVTTVSTNFSGLYKIALEDSNGTYPTRRGQGWPQFLTHITTNETQCHVIVFGTDSQDNIYVGGPVSAIRNTSGSTIT